MKQTAAACFAAALVMAAATTAVNAEDFVFNVPLRYADIHAGITYTSVNCVVYSDAARTDIVAIAIESPRANMDSNGNYTGTLRVAFNARAGRNAADGRYYRCTSHFNNPTTATMERRPGTPFVAEVVGEVPR